MSFDEEKPYTLEVIETGKFLWLKSYGFGIKYEGAVVFSVDDKSKPMQDHLSHIVFLLNVAYNEGRLKERLEVK